MKIKNGLVFDTTYQMVKKDLCFENGIITNESTEGEYDAEGCFVLPGFIDTHIHGSFGVEFYYSEFSGDYKPALDYLTGEGVTGILVTLASETIDEYISDSKRLCECDDDRIIGMHCEGPFLNPEKKGGMHPDKLQKPNIELIDVLQNYSGNKLKIFTIAPELENSERVIKELINRGIKVSLGHSNATYAEAFSAVNIGAERITHTFNAMRSLNHREPGILGLALTDDRVNCELICDLHHVSKPAVELVVRSKGINNVTMISDCSFYCGMPEGKYSEHGRNIYVEGGFAKLENGTICGSACSLAVGAKKMFEIGYKPEEIAVMACVNPAKAAGCKDRGDFKTGNRADVVILDKNFSVKDVFLKGKLFEKHNYCF